MNREELKKYCLAKAKNNELLNKFKVHYVDLDERGYATSYYYTIFESYRTNTIFDCTNINKKNSIELRLFFLYELCKYIWERIFGSLLQTQTKKIYTSSDFNDMYDDYKIYFSLFTYLCKIKDYTIYACYGDTTELDILLNSGNDNVVFDRNILDIETTFLRGIYFVNCKYIPKSIYKYCLNYNPIPDNNHEYEDRYFTIQDYRSITRELRYIRIKRNIHCKNCENIKNCYCCTDCVNCLNSSILVDCNDCKNCDTCVNCKSCISCTECNNCESCRKCEKCSQCTHCKYSKQLNLCNECINQEDKTSVTKHYYKREFHDIPEKVIKLQNQLILDLNDDGWRIEANDKIIQLYNQDNNLVFQGLCQLKNPKKYLESCKTHVKILLQEGYLYYTDIRVKCCYLFLTVHSKYKICIDDIINMAEEEVVEYVKTNAKKSKNGIVQVFDRRGNEVYTCHK